MQKLLFIDRVSDAARLSENCMLALTRALRVRTLEEDDHFPPQQGSSREVILIISGIARVFINTDDGKDVTQYFVRAEDFVIPDTLSKRGELDCLQAITDVEYVSLRYSRFQEILKDFPELMHFYASYINDLNLKARERYKRVSNDEAVDTYAQFLKTHPGLETQVPTAHLASYLGLSTNEFMRARQKYKERGIM